MCPIPGKCARNMGALQQLPEPYLTRQLSRGFPPASTLLPPAARLQMPTWTRASLKWQGSMNWKEPGSFKRHIWSFKSRGIYISALVCPSLPFVAEKAMAPHSSTLAWKLPWTEEHCRLQSMGSRRVGHDRVTSLSLFSFLHWRRKWQPTPVFLPGESQGQGEPGGLPSMGSHRVGHDWSDLAAAAAALCWHKEKSRN